MRNEKGQFLKGQKPWNFGLTIQDSRVKKYTSKGAISKKGQHSSPSTEFKKGQNLGELNFKWKGGKPKCLDCKKELSTYISKYCHKCQFKGNRVVRVARWKGGITSKNKLERTRFKNTIQKKVLERDNWKCVLCKNGGYLQVDHIKSWSKYPELRFNINNCRTLCVYCHYLITFGKKMDKKNRWGAFL